MGKVSRGRGRAVASLLAAAAVFFVGAEAQENRGLLPGIARALGQSAATGALTQGDASKGLKEALRISVEAVTTKLGQENGFFGDAKVRIPLPGLLGRAQQTLSPLGLSGPLDDLQLKVNRGAEAAMPQAKKLFVDAVKGMTVRDAVSIVQGPQDAATQYLRQRSEAQLTALLRPKMETALAQSGAFAALDGAASRAGARGVNATQSLRNDLINFAVSKALDGAFGYIAEEEASIRKDPARRTTDILRRVFGVG